MTKTARPRSVSVLGWVVTILAGLNILQSLLEFVYSGTTNVPHDNRLISASIVRL